MALFQLIEISQGRILLDGIDIRQVPLRKLRSRLSAIPQDAIMFSGTIRCVNRNLKSHITAKYIQSLAQFKIRKYIIAFVCILSEFNMFIP